MQADWLAHFFSVIYIEGQMTKEFLKNGTAVYIDEIHRFGTDAMLLSNFCNVRRLESAVDFCSGCGIIPLRFIDSGAKGRITAIELQPQAAELLHRAKQEQNIDNLEVLCRDLNGFRTEKLYDVVSCNPPYFDSGDKAKSDSRAINRHEKQGMLESVVSTAAAVLKDGGRLCICHRPQRIVDIFCIMRQHKIEPKHMRLVRPKATKQPYLVLIDGRKAGGVGLHLMPDLVVENSRGEHTAEMLRIYGNE